MKTRDKILATALELFNTQGVAKITLRGIAHHMGISQGNLNYHFKKREDIIEALYFQLVEKMDLAMASLPQQAISLDQTFHFSKVTLAYFFEYRFFLLDFVQIIRETPVVRTHYMELSKLRELQFQQLFQVLISSGIMRKEEYEGEYRKLHQRFQILGDFWLSSALTRYEKLTQDVVLEYHGVLNDTLFPYLTPYGKQTYIQLAGLRRSAE